jgi:hypothetical protein
MVDKNTGSIYDLASVSEGNMEKVSDPDALFTAEEYWTKYFAENPQLKPKKIIFYDGDPNQFLDQWKKQNKLELDIPRIGRKIDEDLSDQDYQRYLSVMKGEIDKYYPPSGELQDAIEYVISDSNNCQAEIASLAQQFPNYFELGDAIKGETPLEQLLCFVSHYKDAQTYAQTYGKTQSSSGALEVYAQSSQNFKSLVDKLLPFCGVGEAQIILKYDLPYVSERTNSPTIRQP